MSYFNLAALDAAALQSDPFDHLVVPDFLDSEALAAINRDYPEIAVPGNKSIEGLNYGPAFQAFLDELEGPDFAAHVGAKFGVDLTGCPTTATVRRLCEASDGNIHTDHPSKIITVLVYFNTEWDHEAGCLRMLRSATDIEDYAAEVPPQGGTLLAFRRTDHSYHGHKRFVGERRMVQMNWVKQGRLAQYRQRVDRFSTRLMKRVLHTATGQSAH